MSPEDFVRAVAKRLEYARVASQAATDRVLNDAAQFYARYPGKTPADLAIELIRDQGGYLLKDADKARCNIKALAELAKKTKGGKEQIREAEKRVNAAITDKLWDVLPKADEDLSREQIRLPFDKYERKEREAEVLHLKEMKVIANDFVCDVRYSGLLPTESRGKAYALGIVSLPDDSDAAVRHFNDVSVPYRNEPRQEIITSAFRDHARAILFQGSGGRRLMRYLKHEMPETTNADILAKEQLFTTAAKEANDLWHDWNRAVEAVPSTQRAPHEDGIHPTRPFNRIIDEQTNPALSGTPGRPGLRDRADVARTEEAAAARKAASIPSRIKRWLGGGGAGMICAAALALAR